MIEHGEVTDGRVRPGPARPFSDVAREHLPRLYGLARRLGAEDAEDLVQDALMRAFRGYRSLKSDAAAGSWLTTILVNVFRDRLRKDARSVQQVSLDHLDDFSLYRQIADEDPFPYSDTLHADFLGLFDQEDVHSVLAAMPPLYRVPLVLHYIEGYATKQIARMLGVPLGTVLSRLHRGRKVFERSMWEHAERSGLLDREVSR